MDNAAKMKLIVDIAAACNASRPSKRSVEDCGHSLQFKTTIKDASEGKAGALLLERGYTKQDMKSTGGSSRGDFSSDIYGTKWVHADGSRVEVYSSFRDSPATFNIYVTT